ncbi:MAG: T9SS type A sorting domain-containing protein, partial [Bacteroidota bacterium]
LGLPANQPFDLEGAGEGVCLIWALSFDGFLIGAEIDSNATNLSGCFDLSNPITVIRQTGDDCTNGKSTSSRNLPGAARRVALFPNPFESEITLELTDLRGAKTEVSILDLNGRVIATRMLEMESGRIVIPTTDLTSGAYFLRIVNEGGATTKRIIKR